MIGTHVTLGHYPPGVSVQAEVPEKSRKPALVRRWLLRRLAPLLLLHVVAMVALSLRERSQDRELGRLTATGVLDLQEELLNRELAFAVSTATFLAQQSSVVRFLEGEGDRSHVTADFIALCRQSRSFDHVRILDSAGQELVRVNFRADATGSVDPAELQNKGDRYYFRAAQNLEEADVFVSDFDLNVEHGEIEDPWKPVIRFATPVIHGAGRDTLIINYLGARLLDRLKLAARPLNGWSALVDGSGFFLEAPTQAMSWGAPLGSSPTFATAHADPWEAVKTRTPAVMFSPEGLYLTRPFDATSVLDPIQSNQTLSLVAFIPNSELYADSARAVRAIWALGSLVGLIALLSTVILARAAERRREDEERLLSSEQRLRELSTRLLNAQESERRSVARDLHDELGQIATAVKIDLELADRRPDDRDGLVRRAVEGTERLLESLHAISTRLRTSVLDDLGLSDALVEHCAEVQQRSGMNLDVETNIDDHQVPARVSIHVYRIVQEALNNIVRHADAQNVGVRVAVVANHVTVLVNDDGRGFDVDTAQGRLGLLGMRERVELLGGRLEVQSDPGSGSTVRASLPLAPGDPL